MLRHKQAIRRLEAIEELRRKAQERKLDRDKRRVEFAARLERSVLTLQRCVFGRLKKNICSAKRETTLGRVPPPASTHTILKSRPRKTVEKALSLPKRGATTTTVLGWRETCIRMRRALCKHVHVSVQPSTAHMRTAAVMTPRGGTKRAHSIIFLARPARTVPSCEKESLVD